MRRVRRRGSWIERFIVAFDDGTDEVSSMSDGPQRKAAEGGLPRIPKKGRSGSNTEMVEAVVGEISRVLMGYSTSHRIRRKAFVYGKNRLA